MKNYKTTLLLLGLATATITLNHSENLIVNAQMNAQNVVADEKIDVALVKEFKDVPKTHVYYEIINEMTQKGIISGYEDGTFKPNELISRQHAALLINNAVELPVLNSENSVKKSMEIAKDMPTLPNYVGAFEKMLLADLYYVDLARRIYPEQALTRGEMAKILAVAFNLKATQNHPFSDVEKGTEFDTFISALYSNGVTAGYEDGTFRPDAPVSRMHFAVFMDKAMKVAKHLEEVVQEEIQAIEISEDMSYEDFNKSLIGNELFLSSVTKASERKWDNIYYRRAVTKGQKVLEGTNLKFLAINPGILIQDENWTDRYANGFLSAQISLSINDEFTTMRFDFSSDDAVEVTKKLLQTMYGNEFDLTHTIEQKVKEGREALENGDMNFGNKEIFEFGNVQVKAGIVPTDQYKRFDIEIER